MKRRVFLLAAFFVVASLAPVTSQELISNSSVTGVCYAGNKTNRIYIPPPDEFFIKSGKKGGASITVLYSGFTPSTQAAVEYAVSILESILPADTKFTLSASWEKITSAGVLANSGATGFAGGWSIDAQNPYVLYPVALAEKIAGRSLNDSLDPDITLRINSSVNWYINTNGSTPGNKYDLVTVVLHEICHGLGFFDSFVLSGTTGSYGINSIPMIYDTFIENNIGYRLTDNEHFANPSASLGNLLKGGALYFNGPLLNTYTLGSKARIYTPSVWDPGSSISHLDEVMTAEPNTLMTPFIDMGEAIHNPGNYTMSILGDLGWINTRIIHNANNTERHLSEFPLSVRIQSDTLYDHNNIGVVFSFDNFASQDTLIMSSTAMNDSYDCKVPIPSYNIELKYYFFAQDTFGRIYRSHALPDSLCHTVYIGTDTVKPVISHTLLTSFLEKIDTINIEAIATDNLGIDTVYAEYKLNSGQSQFIGLTAGKENSYSAVINASSLHLNGGDSIQYRIVAIDSAKVPNSSSLPDTGFYAIHIEGLTDVVERYSTDFSGEAANDFINDGFDVSKPQGFNEYGLNSRHPYESPEDNDKTINYTSVLSHPLKFSESGLVISFNEVVLVEPGEPGSLFGSESFYDYVIAEGSKNFGKKWFSLADGYDSRLLTSWETKYNSSIVDMNSTASGDETMLHRHVIYYKPSADISAGDTLLLRFRLFSDPFANGWGWIIQDLKINPLIDAVEKVQPDVPVTIYPNPGNGMIRISYNQDSGSGQPVNCRIFNTSGTCIKSCNLNGLTENIIDISDRPVGIYIIVLNGDNLIKTIKYSLIK